MRRLALFVTFSLTLWGQPPILKSVEKLYNSTTTLQADFVVRYKDRGRPRAPERGVLYLSKQGDSSRTRWEYSAPAGNLFLTDGKFVYDYDKQKNSVDRYPFKQTEDMRIPLSFLLGKLNFEKDFEKFASKQDGANAVITMTPRNKKLLFREITLTVAPDATIRHVIVLDQPGTSAMEYDLDGEKRNQKLPDALFKFVLPPGAQLIDLK